MHHTIFDTPIINTVLRACSIAFLKMTGWKIEGALPPNGQKSVLIAAPHTSNWDLPYTLMVAFALRLNIYWMGKRQLFRFPFRHTMMWLGGIPVTRETSNNVVAASIAAIQAADGPLQLIVPPEGTRDRLNRCACATRPQSHALHGAYRGPPMESASVTPARVALAVIPPDQERHQGGHRGDHGPGDIRGGRFGERDL